MSTMKPNPDSDAADKARHDAETNNYDPPSRPSFIDCTLDPHGADQKTQADTDYRDTYRKEGGK